MKKGWKIALISLGSLLGLVVVVVGIALWLIFTPSQLTSIVNRVAGNFVTCETHFGRVNLTLFKTFPDVGLRIDEVEIDNPIEGTDVSRVAYIDNLTIGLDLKKYLKEGEIVVHQVLIDDLNAYLYIDSAGNSNFDIFPHSDDEDTTESHFSLDSLPNIDLRKFQISNSGITFVNEKGNLYAGVQDIDLCIVGNLSNGTVDADVDLGVDRCAVSPIAESDSPDTRLQGIKMSLKAKGNLDEVGGRLKMRVANGQHNNLINERLQASKHDLLTLNVPFRADLQQMLFTLLDDSRLKVDDYALNLEGDVRLNPLWMDVEVVTDGEWQIEPLLAIVPEQFLGWKKGMDLGGKVALNAKVASSGDDTVGNLPMVNAVVKLSNGRFYMPKSLPYKVDRINADLAARIDLAKKTPWTATINSFKAHTRSTDVSLTGKVDDLLGDMHIDAALRGRLPLADVEPMLPQSLPLVANGNADLDLKANFRLSQLKTKAFDRMQATGTFKFSHLDVTYDSIHATAPTLDVALQLPARQHSGKMADAHVKGSNLQLVMNGVEARMEQPDINIGINNMMSEQLAAAFEIACGETEANIDSMLVSLGALELNGTMRMDSTQDNPLRKFNPVADIDMHSAVFYMPNLPDAVRLSQFTFQYDQSGCRIKNADVRIGHSDFQLYGNVDNLEQWLSHEAMLKADLNFTSNYTDVDQLMDMFSGMGSDKDTMEQMRQEDNVPKEANPFIVPKDVDITLHTHIRRSVAFGNDLNDVAGALTVNDGTAILDQIGFVCKAATMQLTALYRSPRPNNLFVALDFHLLDIRIDELLDMIPTVDTLVPMLAAFNGNANFHLAAETYLDARYQPKMSTLLGSAAISGKDLVVMDDNSIAQIAKLMQFKNWKDEDNKIRIDSLDVELTCFRREIEVYPFLINIGKYQLCASGKHNLSGACNYHVELLKNPLLAKVGVDVRGTLSNPKITLGEVRYADLYRPERQGVVEKRTLEMKRMIKEALESNVR